MIIVDKYKIVQYNKTMLIFVDYNKDRNKWNVFFNDKIHVCHYINASIPPQFLITKEGEQIRGKVTFNGLVTLLDEEGIITALIDKCD